MLSKLFVLSVAELYCYPFKENISKTNSKKMFNLKRRNMEKKKIVVRKDNTSVNFYRKIKS